MRAIGNPNGSPPEDAHFKFYRLFHTSTNSAVRSRTLSWRLA